MSLLLSLERQVLFIYINGRYMPSYELFQDGIDKETSTWRGKGLRFVVNIEREIVGTESF